MVLRAWTELLRRWLPPTTSRVLDVGCGTGSLSALLAGLGYTVTGIDFSPRMLALAQAKVAPLVPRPSFCVMDAATPGFAANSFDVVLSRHLLWALPDQFGALERWAGMLRPGGRLVLIEGLWHAGAGIPAENLVHELPRSVTLIAVETLSGSSALWGKEVDDERYAVIAESAHTRKAQDV